MTNVLISTDQLDLLITSLIVCTMCICFCIGWSCHESGAK